MYLFFRRGHFNYIHLGPINLDLPLLFPPFPLSWLDSFGLLGFVFQVKLSPPLWTYTHIHTHKHAHMYTLPQWPVLTSRAALWQRLSLPLRVWRKGTLPTLFVGIQIGAATMKNSMEISLKTRNKTAIWHSNPTSWHIPWENHNFKRHI